MFKMNTLHGIIKNLIFILISTIQIIKNFKNLKKILLKYLTNN
jgi:hypothetical protein